MVGSFAHRRLVRRDRRRVCAYTRPVRCLHGVHIWPLSRTVPSRRLFSFASRVLDAHPVCTIPRRGYLRTSETTSCFPDAGKPCEPPLYEETLAAPCIIDRCPQWTLFIFPSGPRHCLRAIVQFVLLDTSSFIDEIEGHWFRLGSQRLLCKVHN